MRNTISLDAFADIILNAKAFWTINLMTNFIKWFVDDTKIICHIIVM